MHLLATSRHALNTNSEPNTLYLCHVTVTCDSTTILLKVKEVQYSVTQHRFTEHRLCARHYSRLVERGKSKAGSGPDLCGLRSLVE